MPLVQTRRHVWLLTAKRGDAPLEEQKKHLLLFVHRAFFVDSSCDVGFIDFCCWLARGMPLSLNMLLSYHGAHLTHALGEGEAHSHIIVACEDLMGFVVIGCDKIFFGFL